DTFVSAVWLLGDGKRSPPCKACLRQMKTEWSIPRSGRFQRNAVHPQRGGEKWRIYRERNMPQK
ncbi:TPA: hypothetical protein ACH268_004732, partial [Raoultella ornithinolytica]